MFKCWEKFKICIFCKWFRLVRLWFLLFIWHKLAHLYIYLYLLLINAWNTPIDMSCYHILFLLKLILIWNVHEVSGANNLSSKFSAVFCNNSGVIGLVPKFWFIAVINSLWSSVSNTPSQPINNNLIIFYSILLIWLSNLSWFHFWFTNDDLFITSKGIIFFIFQISQCSW